MSETPGNSIIMKLSGRIDSDNSETVKQELLSGLEGEDFSCVVLDADDLTYISSAGLRMLLQMMKSYPRLSMINVHTEVYEILEMTGFTEMMTIEKAYRSISVEGCEVIGEGANGKVYRIDREMAVKTYKNTDALPEIRNEQNVARLALTLGIPTAISYDVVKVGGSYGSVFELLDPQPFSKILAEHPDKMDWCVREYIDMLKRIHSTVVPEGRLPSINRTAREWAGRMKVCLPPEKGQKLQHMIEEVPETDTMIHGDFHTKNIVLSGGEVLLIDMDTLSTGHPIFEFAQMYCGLIGFYEFRPGAVEEFHGFSAETAREFWNRSLKVYLDTEDDETVAKAENKIRCAAYVRLIDWSMRHQPDDEKAIAERKLWLQELSQLLDQTDTLLLEEDNKAEEDTRIKETENGQLNPEKGVSIGERILRSEEARMTDLHMHSTVSDGTDTPEELLDAVRKMGIPLFSITDHDAVKGCRIILHSRREGDPYFITGVEFSCKDEEGQYHILGYGFDPDSSSIQKLVELGHAYRIRKVRARLDYLKKEFNIKIPDAAVKWLYSMDNPGKPHIGNLMVKYGFAPNKEAAFTNFLNKIRFADDYLRPEETIIGILSSGGIPVLAHPSFGSGKESITGEDLERRVKTLMSYGLKGVEAFYSGFSAEQSKELLLYAGRYGLYVTAGSDYHGENKKVPLGKTGMESVTDLPDGFRRFLKKVNCI